MAYIQEKIKGKKIVSFKFKSCLGRDANGKQIFKCWTWYPPADLTPAKARKEAERVAGRWEEEQRLAFSQQQTKEEPAPPAPVYTFDTFVNEVWIPLCVRDGSHRPATVAMYTNILNVILPQFKGVPIDEITGVRISQYLRWLRNDYRKPDGKPLAEKGENLMLNVRLAFLRIGKGWSREELAQRVGCSTKTVYLCERGRQKPSSDMLLRLAEEFGMTTDYLLTGETQQFDSSEMLEEPHITVRIEALIQYLSTTSE